MKNFGRGAWRRVGDYDKNYMSQINKYFELQYYLDMLKYYREQKHQEDKLETVDEDPVKITVTDEGLIMETSIKVEFEKGKCVVEEEHTVTREEHTVTQEEHTVTQEEHTVTQEEHTVTQEEIQTIEIEKEINMVNDTKLNEDVKKGKKDKKRKAKK